MLGVAIYFIVAIATSWLGELMPSHLDGDVYRGSIANAKTHKLYGNTLSYVNLIIIICTIKHILNDLASCTNHTDVIQKSLRCRIFHWDMESMPAMSASM